MNSSASPNPHVTVTLASVIHAVRWSLSGWALQGMFAVALVIPLFNRLGLIGRQIEAMQARLAAGTLRVGVRRAAAAPRAVDTPVRAKAVVVFPRKFGWLVKAAAWRAAVYGGQLQLVLEMPEMVELLTAAPQAARILRPLCRMLGVEARYLRPGVAEVVKPAKPKKKRVRKPRPKVDWGNIPLPRGMLAWAKKQGFGKVPKD